MGQLGEVIGISLVNKTERLVKLKGKSFPVSFNENELGLWYDYQ